MNSFVNWEYDSKLLSLRARFLFKDMKRLIAWLMSKLQKPERFVQCNAIHPHLGKWNCCTKKEGHPGPHQTTSSYIF
tara:strand:- start:1080 stop:1310 length:231 start_codon:yes stop_codon:yes gene_type:complete